MKTILIFKNLFMKKVLFLLLKLFLFSIIVKAGNRHLYYTNNYYLTNVIVQNDTTLKTIDILRDRIINDDIADSSFFTFKDYVNLDYKDIDKIMSYVYNKSDNVISLNRQKHNPFYKCWLVNAYKDYFNRINVLIKVVELEDILFYKENISVKSHYSNYYLHNSDWQDSSSVLYLVKDIEAHCAIKKSDETVNNIKSYAPLKANSIDFRSVGSTRYPDVKIYNILTDLLGYNEVMVQKDWQSNYYINHQLDSFEMYILDLKIKKSNHKMLKKNKLIGFAYKDRYGRIDVYLYKKNKSRITTSTKIEWYSFKDLHNTLSNCGTQPLYDYKYLQNFEL